MKKTILIFLFFWININLGISQNYVSPSPNAMGLVRLSSQVSHFTGSPIINIPLASLQGRELGVSVSMSYNSFGHRVQDVASSEGLGWSLLAGGIITRVVKGEPDDLAGGFCKPNPTDTEPDIFTFSFNGMSGKFILDQGGFPLLMPFQDILIKPGICKTGGDNTWEITDPNGTRYLFGQARETTTYRKYNSLSHKTIVSSWMLDRIISANGTDEVFFYYENENVSYFNFSYYKDNGQDIPTHLNDVIQNETYELTQNNKKISSIHTSSGKIYFEYDQTREDLVGGKSLSSIRVLDNSNNLVGKTYFKYSYFNSFESPPCKRLKLDAIHDLLAEPIYSFEYEMNIVLPCRDSRSFDYLGLFNENVTNDWIPLNAEFLLAGASRTPSATRSRANIIKKINNRGGSSIEYVFEPHNGILIGSSSSTNVSGNRIKEIRESDGSGFTQVTQYSYLNGSTSSGIIAREPVTFFNIPNRHAFRRYSHSLGDQFDLNGSMIGYSIVEEKIVNKGKTVYTFNNFNTSQNLFSNQPLFSRSTKFWETGVPTTIIVYDESGKIVSYQSFGYNYNLLSNLRQLNLKERLVVPLKNNASHTFENNYQIISKYFNLTSKATRSYDDNDQTKFIVNNENYFYRAPTNQLDSIVTWSSSNPNERLIQVTRFASHPLYTLYNNNCQDQYYSCLDGCVGGGDPNCESFCTNQFNTCNSGVQPSLDDNAKAIYKLREKHINSAIVENYTLIRKGTTNNFIESLITRYQIIGTDSKVFPRAHLRSKKINTTSYIGTHINNSGQFVIPSNFLSTATFSYGSSSGTLQSQTDKDGIVTQYTYSNNNTTLASKTINPGSFAFTTSYQYKPLVGVTRETGPNLKSINMEYDVLNRLRIVKDHNNHIRERYRYHVKNETPNFKIAANPIQILEGQSVTFSLDDLYVPTGGSTTRSWTTGTGITYNDNRQTMTHTYTTSGVYTIQATLSTNEFSPVTRSYTLLVNKPLQVNLCADGPQEKDLCIPSSRIWGTCTVTQADSGVTRFYANFTRLGTGCTGIYNYFFQYQLPNGSWVTFGEGPQNYADFIHNPSSPGYYPIRCTVTDSCNNNVVATSYINIYKSNPNCTPIEY
jgi:hypothetical protein